MKKGAHRDTMARLAAERGWQYGIELGLGSGLLFERFLGLGIEMIGVDLGLRPERRERCEELVRQNERGTIIWANTSSAHRLVPDGWADFVFIDAGHSYQAVREDITNWLPKVKPGGWFGGHDYHEGHPGVIEAVREAFGSAIEFEDGWIWSRIP